MSGERERPRCPWCGELLSARRRRSNSPTCGACAPIEAELRALSSGSAADAALAELRQIERERAETPDA